eukprot:s5627_g6.t1
MRTVRIEHVSGPATSPTIPSQSSHGPATFLLDRIAEISKSMANGQWSEGHDQQTSDGSGPAFVRRYLQMR